MSPPFPRAAGWMLCLLGLASPAWAADAEQEALSLESTSEVGPPIAPSESRFWLEASVGDSARRDTGGRSDFQRVSLDFSWSTRLGRGLRAVFSDRLDIMNPAVTHGSINTLREAYVSWQPENDAQVIELGRISLRDGPGLGYNPTDFLRDGTLRNLTTVNPLALRDSRMGVVMVRAQHLWDGGALSLTLAPKLADHASAGAWSLDLGSTNDRDRGVLALSTRWSSAVSTQALLYKEAHLPVAWGANATALLSDAVVAHGEWSRSREPTLLSRALGRSDTTASANRFVGGLSYTTQRKLSITAEYQYNGFAMDPSAWRALGAQPLQQAAYLRESLRRLDIPSQEATLIYVTQKDAGIKNLDMTAMWRLNHGDRSRLFWAELRHHWPQFDLSLQYQQNAGASGTEFGLMPERHLWQVLGVLYY